jgi:plasmid stabilization system protein ParE
MKLIEKNPFHIASHQRDELSLGARIYNISKPGYQASHFLLYRVNEEKHQVELGRVLHKSVDIKRHLPVDFQ